MIRDIILLTLLFLMAIGSVKAIPLLDDDAFADEEIRDLIQSVSDGAVQNKTEVEMQLQKIKIANRIRNTLKQVKQLEKGFAERQVQTNFYNVLFLMANASAVTGTDVSVAAGTLIRGLVQDQFNFASLAAYFPRLIFLDGPTQFIETLRLLRSGQLMVPRDMESAIDTLINFASVHRDSQIAMNSTPFLSLFPNIFRGSELLSTEVLYGVFQWLVPIGPAEISAASVEGLWNRWDAKSSTTAPGPARQRLPTI